ncbi:hypothetical protein L7F22_022636 [Adiantum nelumboides]|nr:hypothetical protein [Adiantum nelumboides]
MALWWWMATMLMIAAGAAGSDGGSSPTDCAASERNALLAFKAGVGDTHKALQTWSSSPRCCRWHGVSCNSLGRVTRLVVSSIGIVAQRPDIVGATLSNLTELETLVLQNMGSGEFPTLEMPRELKSLRKLVTLSLVSSQFGGPIPTEWSEITTLQHLNLSLNWQINGTIPASLCKLQSLQTLWLSNSFIQGSLTGSIPSCFGSLSHLTGIDLSNNQLKGSIPSELGNLIDLRDLRLSNNMMSGTIPSSLGKLTQLQYLHLQGNTFTGQIPPSLGNLVNLREVRVGGSEDDSGNMVSLSKGLFGHFPLGIGGRVLRVLRIRGTSISGPLSTSLGLTNKNLREVVLDNNAFTGTIPESFGAPKKLVTLNLADNRLQGQIPSLLARSKSKLKSINLSKNLLTGSIPSSFSGLSLSSLDLSHNQLNGSIPVHLGNALLFGVLDLGSNELTGAFPPSLWNVSKITLSNNHLSSLPSGHLPPDTNSHLQQLLLDSNDFAGSIPPWIAELDVLFFVDLAQNKFVSPLPVIRANYVNISHNQLSGSIPEAYGNIGGLNTLDLSFNRFSGRIPANFTSGSGFFNNLVLSHNLLTGPLPQQIFASIFFNSLDLSHNNLSGLIPNTFPDTTPFLSSLDLSFNQLSGAVPPNLFTFSSFLVKVKLGHNQLTGEIPSLGQACQPTATELNFVALNDNKFTGSLSSASWIGECAGKFTVFDISGNTLTGSIPDFSSWTELRVLNLARNRFTGSLPSYLFTSFPLLQVLDLSRNHLSGPLMLNNVSGLKAMVNGSGAELRPVRGGPYYKDGLVFGGIDFVVSFTLTLATTTAIDLSHNLLSEDLAEPVGSLTGLRVLEVANNRISGSLPSSLGYIKSLQILDVSNNSFSGPIPTSLQDFPASDFSGNPGLCGHPLPASCH